MELGETGKREGGGRAKKSPRPGNLAGGVGEGGLGDGKGILFLEFLA